ncbi:putative integral membrane protein [Clostridium tetanomorphum]|uniref:LapA family protein n=1 Tax=Clostridium tetanomorphum TaxID=1553 RepID=A0A923EAG2_CLOTT|nr:LapA family protein [Clostridium tetanomorphum]KAJ49551.1 hypothetical protein CTM_22471 [Clostridium tetanomorphum DSM 665]KAJ53912.1 hypothetical protein CTM_00070 [Clostridium tetanomorphum DSM 665]MBC2398104.1 LapA family protein [Clostridium tetanomorphum]MBP1864673.1 putative integral membrane protein [Clostridium tetanomorphum]NRS84143.1 putative integral membrane protein [Clostridium tetanomorphum]
MQIGFIISLIFAILIAIFAIQNSAIISVNFLFTKIEISQALIIFISVILGAVIVMLLGLKREYNLKRSNKLLNKKIEDIEKENSNLLKENTKLKEEINNIEKVESSFKESAVDINNISSYNKE